MSSEVLLAGSDTPSYTQQPVDQHRRKRNHDSPTVDEGTQLHFEKMASQLSDWSTHGAINLPNIPTKPQSDWLRNSDGDEKGKYKSRRWSLLDSPGSSTKGRASTRSYFTYLLFSVMIGINIYIIARSFAMDPQQKHHVLHQDDLPKERLLIQRDTRPIEAKSYDLEEYYGSRDSPMFCDLCPSGNEFCKSIG